MSQMGKMTMMIMMKITTRYITEDESEDDDDSMSIKMTEVQYKRSINHLCNQNVPCIHL